VGATNEETADTLPVERDAMKSKLLRTLALTIALCLLAPASWAHHSTAMFDLSKVVTYRGTITKMVWANPHCFIYFDGVPENAAANAPVEHWAVEGQSPSVMFNHGGWDENTAKVGDKVILTGNPRKDGVPTMLLMNASVNGKNFQVMARQAVNAEKK
jgi:hypothetical protein